MSAALHSRQAVGIFCCAVGAVQLLLETAVAHGRPRPATEGRRWV